MMPMLSTIFHIYHNKEKSNVRTKASLNSQAIHSILKIDFSVKEPC